VCSSPLHSHLAIRASSHIRRHTALFPLLHTRPSHTQRPSPCRVAPHLRPRRGTILHVNPIHRCAPVHLACRGHGGHHATTTLTPPRGGRRQSRLHLPWQEGKAYVRWAVCGGKGRPTYAELFILDVPFEPKLAGYRSPQSGRPWLPATPCLKCFRHFQLMFQVFHLNVTKVDLGCCIRCNGNIRMLQAYVSSISGVLDICFKSFIRMF
jgi:hypothetical protein